MEDQDPENLLKRYAEGKATERELGLLDSWYLAAAAKPMPESHTDQLKLKQIIWNRIHQQDMPIEKKLWGMGRLRVILTSAAAIAAITLGIWFYLHDHTTRHQAARNQEMVRNGIRPGHNTATLSLANGTIIELDTNKSIVTVSDSVKTTTMLTASTPRGGTYQVVLPDGTRVWLNADSKISFPSRFSGKTRQIQLSGEAYLEVAKDKTRPFVVKTDKQQIEVLGTHFNVNAYPEEAATKTTLLEGRVKVSQQVSQNHFRSPSRNEKTSSSVELKPGQQSVVSESPNILIKNIDPEQAIAWKNQLFMFESENIQTIMRMIGRWYNVDIVYTGPIKSGTFSGGVSRFDNLSEVLQSLESTGKVHFKLEGRRITVTD